MSEWKPRRSPRYNRVEGPQNRSPAVMAQRFEPLDGLDDFPTPRWATRALMEWVLPDSDPGAASCWEPTCGRGYMAATLSEYFASVRSSDIHPFGFGETLDFFVREVTVRLAELSWQVVDSSRRVVGDPTVFDGEVED